MAQDFPNSPRKKTYGNNEEKNEIKQLTKPRSVFIVTNSLRKQK